MNAYRLEPDEDTFLEWELACYELDRIPRDPWQVIAARRALLATGYR